MPLFLGPFYGWKALVSKSGSNLFQSYGHTCFKVMVKPLRWPLRDTTTPNPIPPGVCWVDTPEFNADEPSCFGKSFGVREFKGTWDLSLAQTFFFFLNKNGKACLSQAFKSAGQQTTSFRNHVQDFFVLHVRRGKCSSKRVSPYRSALSHTKVPPPSPSPQSVALYQGVDPFVFALFSLSSSFRRDHPPAHGATVSTLINVLAWVQCCQKDGMVCAPLFRQVLSCW